MKALPVTWDKGVTGALVSPPQGCSASPNQATSFPLANIVDLLTICALGAILIPLAISLAGAFKQVTDPLAITVAIA
jgi:hypothetical protein